MDNVTHSLAGLLLAESATRLRARLTRDEPSPRFRAIAAISSMIAANLPDADLFYTGVGGDRLKYLLHHRGYTHTVVIALVGAGLVCGCALLVWRWRAGAAARRADAGWLLGLLIASTFSHLVLDWTNSYGVHPFWPVDDRWRYGDSVFIVEPWLWVVSIPALVAASTRRVARLLLSLVLIVGLALAWRVDLVAPGAAIALTLGAVLFVVLARTLSVDGRVVSAVGGWLLATCLLAAGAAQARRAVITAVREVDPATELLDVVVSPLPANPFCASVVTVERSGATYRVVTARVSAVPGLVSPMSCAVREGNGVIARSSTRQATNAVEWQREWSAPVAELARLARRSCVARAALRFMRVPIWRPMNDSTVVLGDGRFGGGSGGGFTDIIVRHRAPQCPAAVPPWTPPRAGLLQ
jgi:inner membrane protein